MMFREKLAALFFALALLTAAGAGAQIQIAPPAPDQSADMQAIQQGFQTMMQNIQAKGLDPQTFFQQFQNGGDPADIQKMLVDQGILDQKTLDQMQGAMQHMAMGRIKQELNVTSEDEWKAIQPLIQKVMDAAADLNRGRPGAMNFMTGKTSGSSDVANAIRDLRAALKDPASTSDQVKSLLQNLRDAEDKARGELTEAESELEAVLTVRQEGILLLYGILQ